MSIDAEATTIVTSTSAMETPIRPILVGYAFGPKKMSTMNIVMAEASQALSTVIVSVNDSECVDDVGSNKIIGKKIKVNRVSREQVHCMNGNGPGLNDQERPHDIACSGSPLPCSSFDHNDRGGVKLTKELLEDRIDSRFKRFSSTTSESSSMISALAQSYTTFNRVSDDSSSASQLRLIRVSFVPLDLDSPLEEQHGGKFDAILHKLTEDILCVSKMNAQLETAPEEASRIPPASDVQKQAISRVQTLTRYKQHHPCCYLIDDPENVKAVMSRADIANMLSKCLVDVTTKSGIPVCAPRYLLIDDTNRKPIQNENKLITSQIEKANFRFPLIAKPLIAAGTSESHQMVIILGKSGLFKLQYPCIVQEYANHDETLFKVYVMGDKVWVFPRSSLPNLPLGDINMDERFSFLEFDSQKAYPKLSDFQPNAITAIGTDQTKKRKRKGPSKETNHYHPQVTSDEIRPVASVLRKVFGLELFGFDILVTDSRQGDAGSKQMLVVDVNYFPSYKEVFNFPRLLAQYLTQRAVEVRKLGCHALDKN